MLPSCSFSAHDREHNKLCKSCEPLDRPAIIKEEKVKKVMKKEVADGVEEEEEEEEDEDEEKEATVAKKKKDLKVEFVNSEKRKNSVINWIKSSKGTRTHGNDTRSDHYHSRELKSIFSKSFHSRSPQLNDASCKRLNQPRLSLLGRPIVCRPIKPRDPRYRRLQTRTHNLLERPRGTIALLYHLSL